MQVSRIKLVIKSLAIKYTKIAYKVLNTYSLQPVFVTTEFYFVRLPAEE
jgi:hypothetical protein